jgi:hypothetical protein
MLDYGVKQRPCAQLVEIYGGSMCLRRKIYVKGAVRAIAVMTLNIYISVGKTWLDLV